MPNTIEEARRLIQSRLAALETEARTLRKALEVLGDGAPTSGRRGRPKERRAARARLAATAPKPRAAKKAPATPRRRKVRAPRGQRRQQLLAALRDNPGARPAELAAAIGISASPPIP